MDVSVSLLVIGRLALWPIRRTARRDSIRPVESAVCSASPARASSDDAELRRLSAPPALTVSNTKKTAVWCASAHTHNEEPCLQVQRPDPAEAHRHMYIFKHWWTSCVGRLPWRGDTQTDIVLYIQLWCLDKWFWFSVSTAAKNTESLPRWHSVSYVSGEETKFKQLF